MSEEEQEFIQKILDDNITDEEKMKLNKLRKDYLKEDNSMGNIVQKNKKLETLTEYVNSLIIKYSNNKGVKNGI